MDFLKNNAGKIAIVVVILVAAVFLAMRGWDTGDPMRGLPDKITYVCVQTGEFFEFPRGQAVVLPLENPDTGERTLVPVYEQEGEWYVSQRRSSVLRELGERNKYVDPETLKVREPG